MLTHGGLSIAEVRAFWDRGARASICVHDGRLVGYSWHTSDNYLAYDWIRIRLNGQIYVSTAYLAPEFRGRRIHSENRYFAFPALGELGYDRVISLIESLNRSSLHSGRDEPRHYVGRIWYLRLLGLVIYRIDNKWGAGFWHRGRPFDLSFDVFDRESFEVKNKHARSGLERG